MTEAEMIKIACEQFPIEGRCCREKRMRIERLRKQYVAYMKKKEVREQKKSDSRCETGKCEIQ